MHVHQSSVTSDFYSTRNCFCGVFVPVLGNCALHSRDSITFYISKNDVSLVSADTAIPKQEKFHSRELVLIKKPFFCYKKELICLVTT